MVKKYFYSDIFFVTAALHTNGDLAKIHSNHNSGLLNSIEQIGLDNHYCLESKTRVYKSQGWRKVKDSGVALHLVFSKSGVAPDGTIYWFPQKVVWHVPPGHTCSATPVVYLKSVTMPFLRLSANRYGLWLSNEPLFIIIAHGAAKLCRVQIGGPKMIQPPDPFKPLFTK